uniref:Uncharacterized protein n=1 Tax=Knipowitschia caucasica TaxID=637954 RepID=A0AAV2L9E1_KNICA
MASWSDILPPSPSYPPGHGGKRQKRGAQQCGGLASPLRALSGASNHCPMGVCPLMPLTYPSATSSRQQLTWSVRNTLIIYYNPLVFTVIPGPVVPLTTTTVLILNAAGEMALDSEEQPWPLPKTKPVMEQSWSEAVFKDFLCPWALYMFQQRSKDT